MDEAERCTRVVYLAGGRLVVQGTTDEVVREARLVVYEGSGRDVEVASPRRRSTPDVESAAIFGRTLRAVGTDRGRLEAALEAATQGMAVSWAEVPPRLDDVFIHLLREQDGEP